jgi:LmbE family N-acetylglucosaminyl deacetylase
MLRLWLGTVPAIAFAAAGICVPARAGAPEPEEPAAILEDLRSFRQMGSVLYVAAHPDDENTQLVAYLARGRSYRTAYLSVTRGDGGQNLLGAEFGDELGVIRTQELLGARRIDGGRQFFTRARDFGYSKDYRQTLLKWDREEVVGDIVRVIRGFRPDVVITRFSPEPGTTHGHHTASAVLAIEAFKRAGDPKAYPEQLVALEPWQPRRLLMNTGGPVRGSPDQPSSKTLHMEIGGNDPVTGQPFGAIASRSRSMHKTQGFGFFAVGTSGSRSESFQLLLGEPAANDIFDGVDTSWGRVPGGAEIGRMADEVIDGFDRKDPSASVPRLLEIKKRLVGLPKDPIVDEKRGQLDRIIGDCLGLSVETTVARAEVVPGESVKINHRVEIHSAFPVRWMAVGYPSLAREMETGVDLVQGKPSFRDSAQTLPAGTPASQPYWLKEEGTPGMFRVDETSLIGQPENPPILPVEYRLEVAGQTIVLADEPVERSVDSKGQEIRRRIEAIPPVSLHFPSEVALFAPSASRQVAVEIVAFRTETSGLLHLDAPEGWKIAPSEQSFRLSAVGDRTRLLFTVTAPPRPATAALRVWASLGDGTRFFTDRVEIRYSHIPPILLQPPAAMKAVCLDLAIHGSRVGYVAGAGDSVAMGLEEMGYSVTPLTGADFVPDRLKPFDAVVIGVRAFNTRSDLASGFQALLSYVEAGGTVVAQYNTPNALPTTKLGPYPLALSRNLPANRVTDENAPVAILLPDHPAFTTPNRIDRSDFDGWVQERGLNFPSEWDSRYVALLACGDPGEAPLKSGILVARYGKGYYVYTGLSWFRQLPAGVPGAYRIFANLVSLGK